MPFNFYLLFCNILCSFDPLFSLAFNQIQFNPLFHCVTICITLSVEVNALWGSGGGRAG